MSPIGQHRARHIALSKGKRSKKRKRQEAILEKGIETTTLESAPPQPEVSRFIVVGLNSITRILKSSLQNANAKPKKLSSSDSYGDGDTQACQDEKPDGMEKATTEERPNSQFIAIFVSSSSHLSIIHAHLQGLLATASLAHQGPITTRLIRLPKGSEERLCKALGLPRASIIGLFEGAPYSSSLVEFVQNSVGPIEAPWLLEGKEAQYLPVKINSIQTSAPVVKKN